MTLNMSHLSKASQTLLPGCWNGFKSSVTSCSARVCTHSSKGIKKNRDDFCVISNEIRSLIESVVRYAREHKPVSERYTMVCDEFLSSVYSLLRGSILADRNQSALYHPCNPKWSWYSGSALQKRKLTKRYLRTNSESGPCAAIFRYQCRKSTVKFLTKYMTGIDNSSTIDRYILKL